MTVKMKFAEFLIQKFNHNGTNIMKI